MKPSLLRTPLLCLALLAMGACGKGNPQGPPQMPAPEVGVLKATPQDLPLTRDLVGRLSPYRSSDVRARVPGVLFKRTYDEGTDVKQGQLLFQIDPAPLKAALDANSGALAQAMATSANASTFAQRARELAPKGYISKVDLDNALAAERNAAAAVQAARANVQSARINLGYASVRAPIAGRAGQQQVTEGALVGSGEATLLTTIDQIDSLYVNFTMSVSSMEQMRRAQSAGGVTLAKPDQASVQVTLPDGSTDATPGVVNFSDSSVNPATGSVNLRATIPNSQHTLLPGMYVTLKAKLGEQHNVFLIPQAAVLRDTTGAYVLTVQADGKVNRNDVTTTDMLGGDWIVTGGVKDGDAVVVSGIQNVKAGATAKASPWHPVPASGSSTTQAPGSARSGK